ncbi:hypothetical protein SmJEL517_g03124 [Synchytrium microbalum]|uniref:TAP42-like protein n=1 Tax=Synchytrium microbalum TaxID=1806994 RepID=A0A507C9I9_9FUNG|nr:uncharacterized protein SmJEL517_g03124 [Synchytrium microbalum]TPX34213.1 hypothetical protein SmJEL517_g03124 [Synchytrium microbalum]
MISAQENEGTSLRTEFSRGKAAYKEVEDSPLASIDPKYQTIVSDCLLNFTKCAFLVRQLSLFSDNEILDDIVTTDLRYILVDYFLGETTLKQVSPKLERMQVINVAEMYLSRYLTICDDYAILDSDDAKRWHAMTRKNEDGDLVDSNTTERPPTRDEKIARYKREKETKKRLEDLLSRRKDQEIDEDIERDIILTSGRLYAQTALESIRLIRDERVILLEMEQIKRDKSHELSSQLENNSDTRVALKDRTGPLMNPQGRIMRPFVITSKREEVRRGVFRPGWNLPTMTIEEYLDLEMERGNMLSGGTGEETNTKVVEDSDYDAQDQATLKAREWDDFTDDNPKGWGNRGANRG